MKLYKRTKPDIQNPESRTQHPVTTQEALAKILRYCAYQERSHKEVKNKLFEYGLRTHEVDEILAHLITEGFLNEARYAKAFAGGKFRIMKWGRLKIQRELEWAGLTQRCIKLGLSEIDSSDYAKAAKKLIEKKAAELSEEDPFKKKNKIAQFLIGKGYEPELVWGFVNDLIE